jgi:hypothetical protein
MDALFDLPGTAPTPSHDEPTLAIDVPTATPLDDAIRTWRDTFTAVQRGQALPEFDLTRARHDVVMAARAHETREHTIDWLGATHPHLIGVACSCGDKLAGFILVDLAAAKVVKHVENGARL